MEELCTLSKREAVSFLRENFWRLVSLFNTLKPTFDVLLEKANNSESGTESDDDPDPQNEVASDLESNAYINSDKETVSAIEENNSADEIENEYRDITKDKILGHNSEDKVEVAENIPEKMNSDDETTDAEFEDEADYSDYQSDATGGKENKYAVSTKEEINGEEETSSVYEETADAASGTESDYQSIVTEPKTKYNWGL